MSPLQPRASVLTLRPYGAPHEGRRGKARLDFNENTVGFADTLATAGCVLVADPNTWTAYPEYQAFIEELARFLKVEPPQLLLTNGSDEALAVIAQTFIDPERGDRAVISRPTFDMIPHYLHLNGAQVTEVPLLEPELVYDIAGLEAAIEAQQPSVVMLASPDNPTGATISPQQIATWCGRFPDTLFVVDEAYAEYTMSRRLEAYAEYTSANPLSLRERAGVREIQLSDLENVPLPSPALRAPSPQGRRDKGSGLPEGEGICGSVLPFIQANTYPNLLLTRTFSKAWGLAGVRLGVIVGPSELIDWLRRVRSPYSVNALAVEAAHALLPQAEQVIQQAQGVMQRKKTLIEALTERGYRTWPKKPEDGANFFLLGVGPDAQALCDHCAAQGVLIRNRSHTPMLEGLIRISIGTEAENQRLLDCLDSFREQHALLFDLDDTLVDTSQSFDVTVMRLMEQYSGQPLERHALESLRMEGGFNDDWDATLELLKRRGITTVSREAIAELGTTIYHQLAPTTETLLLDRAILERLGKRYRLGMVTGRYREEYDLIWADRLSDLFETIVWRDDPNHLAAKPSPEPLVHALNTMGLAHGNRERHRYIGNSVDDMTAARSAGMQAVGVVTSQTLEALIAAGGHAVLKSSSALKEYFRL